MASDPIGELLDNLAVRIEYASVYGETFINGRQVRCVDGPGDGAP